jgi:chorismate mutase
MQEIKTGKLIHENSQIWQEPSDNLKIEKIRQRLEEGILRILGPCAAQSEEQAVAILNAIREKSDFERASGVKPRTDRFTLEGEMGYAGVGIPKALEIYKKINELNTGVGIATEIMSGDHLKAQASEIELAWIGSRTQDQFLLESIGRAAVETQTPLMIKNAMIPDVQFDIGRINNVIYGINKASKELGLPPVPVMFCLRGNHPGKEDSEFRNVPNWEMIDIIKKAYPDLPIIIDPSHIFNKDEEGKINPEAVLQLLIDAFNRKSDYKPDGYMVEVYHEDHPSVTDPGVEVQAILKLLAENGLS